MFFRIFGSNFDGALFKVKNVTVIETFLKNLWNLTGTDYNKLKIEIIYKVPQAVEHYIREATRARCEINMILVERFANIVPNSDKRIQYRIEDQVQLYIDNFKKNC